MAKATAIESSILRNTAKNIIRGEYPSTAQTTEGYAATLNHAIERIQASNILLSLKNEIADLIFAAHQIGQIHGRESK